MGARFFVWVVVVVVFKKTRTQKNRIFWSPTGPVFFAGWAGSSLAQHLAARQNSHAVGKAVDSSGISHHLSTEKSRCFRLFTPARQRRSRASTGFEATQVGVWQRKMGVIHKSRRSLLLLLCIHRATKGEERTSPFSPKAVKMRRFGVLVTPICYLIYSCKSTQSKR